MLFDQLGLSEQLLTSLKEEGYRTPTPIQEKVIPTILDNQDVMAAAQTGTGKTAAFTLPLLDKLSQGEKAKPFSVRALILTPTRELAAQVVDSVKTYGKHLSLTSTVVFGGVKINPQISRLSKGVDILVATPGRLLDIMHQRAVQFEQLEVLVLDEADRMLDMGFIDDIRKIIAKLPKKRQTLLFSATFSNEIRSLAKSMMKNIVEVSVTPPNSTVKKVKQIVHPVDKKQKNALLSHLIWENKWEQVLVFTKTKWGANKLAEYLTQDGMEAVAIHGNKSQGARTRALNVFKNKEARVMVATDIAARGLDIELLPHVVNFDLPQVAEDYVHRIGRTARAGASGEAITLLSADEFRMLAEIERLIKQKIPRETVAGFEPNHAVPEITLDNDRPRAPRQNQMRKDDRRYESRGRSSRSFESADSSRKPKRFDDTAMPRIQKAERFERVSKQEWPAKKSRSASGTSAPNRRNKFDSADRPKRFDRDDRAEKSTRFSGRPEKKNGHPEANLEKIALKKQIVLIAQQNQHALRVQRKKNGRLEKTVLQKQIFLERPSVLMTEMDPAHKEQNVLSVQKNQHALPVTLKKRNGHPEVTLRQNALKKQTVLHVNLLQNKMIEALEKNRLSVINHVLHVNTHVDRKDKFFQIMHTLTERSCVRASARLW